jgi:UDP-glucuronate decarboxylase
MHLFVTGGTGFFGKALLRHWCMGGTPELGNARFTLLSRDPARFRATHGDLLAGLDVHFAVGDIQRPETLPRGDYTHVLHAAADSTMGLLLTPLERFNQIVDGTRHVFDLALRSGKPRVLLISSGGVYGPQPSATTTMPESYTGMAEPLNPHNAYSVGKRMAEHLGALYHEAYGLDTMVARCFAFVGKDLPLDAHFAVGNFISDALAGRDIVIQGDGTPLRSYLDQRDLAHWLTTLLLRGEPQRAYNVGADEAVSIADLAALVSRLAGGRSQVRVLGKPSAGQAAQRNRYVPDISRARKELGLTVRYPLHAAIADTLAELRGVPVPMKVGR